MFCVIASYDTVVSHSPCKLRVSIHKNKIEAGNWLSRVEERERAKRPAVCQRKASVGVFSQWLNWTRSWASSETFVSNSCSALENGDDLVTGTVTHWGKEKVSRGSGYVRDGLRKVHKQSQDHSGAAGQSHALFLPEKVEGVGRGGREEQRETPIAF